ncbi:MAG TPA: GFA family protein [Anaeromyxobacteraceae bacterium]|nr:GFA family protein [Anaeromyxobacteraceae bacterium]
MSEEKTWTGGCHCGAVRYRATMALEGAVTCNCSICSKTGTMLAFVPASKFELLSGADALADYQFGKKQIHHLFCSRCGVRSFSRGAMPDGQPIAAINVRCLDGVELEDVKLHSYDGRSVPIDG